jgi:hypothetical protein
VFNMSGGYVLDTSDTGIYGIDDKRVGRSRLGAGCSTTGISDAFWQQTAALS